MKKYLSMLGVLLFIFVVGITNVKAVGNDDAYVYGAQLDPNCESNGLGGKNCSPRLIVNRTMTVNELRIDIYLSKLELSRTNPIVFKSGWYETETRTTAANAYTDAAGVVYDRVSLVLSNGKKTLSPSVYELATIITEPKAGVNLENCKVLFVVKATYESNSCKTKDVNGTTKYYDRLGNEVSEDEYYADCFGCEQILNEARTAIIGYRGPNGRELVDDSSLTAQQKWYNQCYTGDKRCKWVLSDDLNSITYYGQDGRIIQNQSDYIKECYNNSCEALLISNTGRAADGRVYFFDRNNEFTDEDGYFKSCFPCQYYKNTEADTQASDEALYKPIYTGFIDAEGKKTDEIGYLKSCQTFSCAILADGTHYDKNGNIVSEDEYLKSCFKCRKENGKFYDENGKETTEDNWKVMCEPHKCQYLGGKYFNDKGAIVTKAEYDKACTNPKTGDKETIRMYLYIFGGFALTVAIILGSRKFAKVNKIK